MASTPDVDLQQEQIDPHGIDASYLLSDGWIDFEHDRDQVIGVPTKNTHVDQKGLFLEAKLFKNMPQVQDIINLYHNIKDNHINRKLGFSIEGNVLERDEDDDSIIRQVQITGVAVTKNPANTDATWELVSKSIFGLDEDKSVKAEDNTNLKPMMSMTVKINKKSDDAEKALTAGHGISPATQTDGAAFRAERLSNALISLADELKEARKIGLSTVGQSVAEIISENKADDEVAVAFLQLFEGISRNDALTVVHAINAKDLTESRLEHLLGSETDDDDDDDD